MCDIIFVSLAKIESLQTFYQEELGKVKKKSGALLLHMKCTVQSGSF